MPGGQRYCPADATAEGDWSQGAFFLAAQAMGHDLDLAGLSPDSRQGDRIVTEYLARLDAPGEAELDVRDCPDLVPALAARAALRDGEITRITNAARLRLKESDRLGPDHSRKERTGRRRGGGRLERPPDRHDGGGGGHAL